MLYSEVVVLVSCMHQDVKALIKQLKLETDAIVINQCEKDNETIYTYNNAKGKLCQVRLFNTTERGLSKSRNMAIRNAPDDCVCLLCDDDESLATNYESLILEGYKKNPDADVMAFALNWNGFGKTYPQKEFKLSLIDTLRVSSVQITFKSSSIKHCNILFDEMLGSGTGNGAGEENRFMLDCRKNKLKMYYKPSVIATIEQGESKWFNGFDKKYFNNFGWSAHRVYKNIFITIAIVIYAGVKKYPLYKKEYSMKNALLEMIKGVFEKR